MIIMSGLITTKGKNIALDRIYNGGTYSNIEYVQIGMCNKTPVIGDTKVYFPIPITTSNRETIDACDATTGWNVSGDATSVELDTTAGNRLEGTGSLDLRATYSTGTATYYKTVSSFDGSTDYLFVALYINDLSQLEDTTDTVSIHLGTSGFTNYNIYNFNYDLLKTGWNGIVCDIDNPDSVGGSGATEATIDSVKVNLKITEDLADDDIIMDWIHTYPVADTYITWSLGYPSYDEVNKTVSTRFEINSTQANGGYVLRECGFWDTTKTYLYRRDTYSSVSKDQYITLTWDLKDKIN